MYKKNFALNNLQWLICHKSQPNKTIKTIRLVTKTLLILNRIINVR